MLPSLRAVVEFAFGRNQSQSNPADGNCIATPAAAAAKVTPLSATDDHEPVQSPTAAPAITQPTASTAAPPATADAAGASEPVPPRPAAAAAAAAIADEADSAKPDAAVTDETEHAKPNAAVPVPHTEPPAVLIAVDNVAAAGLATPRDPISVAMEASSTAAPVTVVIPPHQHCEAVPKAEVIAPAATAEPASAPAPNTDKPPAAAAAAEAMAEDNPILIEPTAAPATSNAAEPTVATATVPAVTDAVVVTQTASDAASEISTRPAAEPTAALIATKAPTPTPVTVEAVTTSVNVLQDVSQGIGQLVVASAPMQVDSVEPIPEPAATPKAIATPSAPDAASVFKAVHEISALVVPLAAPEVPAIAQYPSPRGNRSESKERAAESNPKDVAMHDAAEQPAVPTVTGASPKPSSSIVPACDKQSAVPMEVEAEPNADKHTAEPQCPTEQPHALPKPSQEPMPNGHPKCQPHSHASPLRPDPPAVMESPQTRPATATAVSPSVAVAPVINTSASPQQTQVPAAPATPKHMIVPAANASPPAVPAPAAAASPVPAQPKPNGLSPHSAGPVPMDATTTNDKQAEGLASSAAAMLPHNRLKGEKSLHLLQHAQQPVHWYSWGEEAFAAARAQNKPIFLSIGYSTCHWCHVMAKESFEDPDVAAALNKAFVNIKVDREERPDVDSVYMLYVQATHGDGGWPMSVWLTPKLQPILGGTYFPAKDSYQRPGFPKIIQRITEVWSQKSAELETQGDDVLRQIREHLSSNLRKEMPTGHQLSSHEVLLKVCDAVRKTYDPVKGGFANAPKFPRPVLFQLLFFTHSVMPKTKEGADAKEMALFTLNKIACGGMTDTIGGGFHRYSVTSDFHIPHFEKMLYDNAQLASAFLDAYQISRNEEFAAAARNALQYITTDLTSPDGGIMSAEDADSLPDANATKPVEGAFYVWTRAEIMAHAGEQAGKAFCDYYDVREAGNVPPTADPSGQLKGKNVLIRRKVKAEVARANNVTENQLDMLIGMATEKLKEARSHRPRPMRDDSIIASWNGLAIAALARGYQVLGESRWLNAAIRAADFVRTRMYFANRTLAHSYRGNACGVKGFASDYAFMIAGLIELYQASFDITYLQWAVELQQSQNEHFFDKDAGGYWNTDTSDKHLPFRLIEDYDGAEPSTNSVSVWSLVKLSRILKSFEHQSVAQAILDSFKGLVVQSPLVLPLMATALYAFDHPPTQIIFTIPVDRVCNDEKDPSARSAQRLAVLQPLLRGVQTVFQPNQVLLALDGEAGQKWLCSQVKELLQVPNKSVPMAYVCRDFACAAGTTNPDELKARIAARP